MQQLHMLVFSLFLFWISHPVNALETVYGAEGGDIVLMPPLQSPSPPITSIQWKHGEDIVAEWYEVYGTETYCLTKFKGRCKLNLLTGALTITGLTKTDSGICKPEINNKYLDSTHLIVISRVPKPSVSKSCNTEMTACNLTCEGNTIESESVDCKWLLDDAEGPSGKVLTITKEMKEQSYRCVFVNPVGNKTSDIMTNPLLKENVNLVSWLTAAAAAVGVLGLIGLTAYLINKCRTARGSYGFVPTKEEDNNVIKVHVPPTTQDSDSLCNGSVIPEEQRASNEPSDSIPLQSVCNGAARGSYGFVPTKEEDNNVIEVHVPPTTQDSDSLCNGSVIPEEQRASNEPSDSIPLQSVCNGAVIPEEQRASNEPSDSIPLQSVCNGAGSYKSVPTKEEDNNVEVHVPPTTQDSDSLSNGSVIPEEQRASNEPSDSIPLQSVCNGAARGSYGFVPTKEEDNNVIEVHVPPTTQDSDSLSNGSVIPEEQRASNEPSDSIPLQSICNGAGSYKSVPTKEEDNNVIEVHVPPTTQDSDSLSNGSVIPEEQRASNEPSDSIPLQSICNGAGSYKSVPTKEEDNNVIEVHVPPTTQDSDSLCNGSVIPEEQRASNEPSDSIPLQSICNGAARGSYGFVPTKEEDNNVIEVHVPPTTQDSDSLCNGSVIPEEQRASNEPSDSIPLQNVCNGAGKASEISSNNDLTTSTSPEAGKEADITSEMGPESPQDSITPETGKETEITSDVVEKSDENSTTPASPASSQETGDLATKPPDQEQTNQEPPAAEQEADDAGDLDEH
ncbi:papilin isoform X15 [Labrus bergylta]|uniref:papilin isoform X15 n=1 Tax=Labrus bergylta TaxID=56723 RepID=UPI00331337DD